MLIREVWSILLVLCSIGRAEDNVALNKTAEQSSDLFVDKWLANKAVDGCENTNVYSDCCTHTGPNTEEAWWRVDLGELMTVNQITIYYRDPFQYRFAGYYLYLSNTTDSPIDGVLCYKDQSINRADVQLVVTHECPYVARYVTVYNYRNDTKRHSWYSDESFLELCEVQVYGCPIGMYGDGDCNSRCSAACNGGNCNSTSGTCSYGCKPGFCGDHCDKSCPSVCSCNTCDQTTSACTEENSNMRAAAIGIGTGFGLTIVILVIVVIVLARSLRKTQSDNKSPSDVTDISELDRGVTYDEIEEKSTSQDTQVEIVDGNYEKLQLERMEFHLYQAPGAVSE